VQVFDSSARILLAGAAEHRRVNVHRGHLRDELPQLPGQQAFAAANLKGAPAAGRDGPKEEPVIARVVVLRLDQVVERVDVRDDAHPQRPERHRQQHAR
jgi:hypothetical protein